MHMRVRNIGKGKKMSKTVIVDIDGTIADITHRLPLIQGESPDWNKFYSQCFQDKPILPMIEVVRGLCMGGFHIAFMTGRVETVRKETYDWILKNCGKMFENCALYMRSDGDHRPDSELKSAMYDQDFKKQNVVAVIEDRNQCVEMWRKKGLVCLQCANGDY